MEIPSPDASTETADQGREAAASLAIVEASETAIADNPRLLAETVAEDDADPASLIDGCPAFHDSDR